MKDTSRLPKLWLWDPGQSNPDFWRVYIAGCSDQAPGGTTTVPTTAVPTAKYVAGDIIGKTASATENTEYIITKFDISTDQYHGQLLYKNANGSWGHFINNHTEKVERTLVEKVYPVKISHVNIASIPIIPPTVPPTVPLRFPEMHPVYQIFHQQMVAEYDCECNHTGDNFRVVQR